jgi:hypothetical protein
VRQQCPGDRAETRKHAPATHEGKAQAHMLDDVASIHDHRFEHAPSQLELSELEAVDDPAGDPHEDDNADLHADRNSGGTRRLRHEQDERRVIAGKRACRRNRRDGDHGRRTRDEH